ncbi:Glycosyl transferase, group 1 [Bradyrhizobium sp. STM 3843]|uniref:glycosyltransferase n=1 Tax=Bradyrhizobium sp. STM 3843 TaxID=551947 RepID=UPI000240A93F|nr:glycosyltransferase [Bradyrhizobium sp. STM 3843]CCE06131.1 Glycosyl transferase, group 1 [Bradyrhizobium sp. STM 3843]
MRKLTILSVAFPFALVGPDPVGGAEQILSSIDHALTRAGHRSIVIAAEGSQTSGDLIAVPRPAQPISTQDWHHAHDFLRMMIRRIVDDAGADLVHLHGVDFQNYLPPPGVPVLATLHLPLSSYSPSVLNPERPRTWLNTVSHHQHQALGAHSRVISMIENGIDAPPLPAGPKGSFALALGRICPEKGFHLALAAATAADIALLLAGTTSGFPEHLAYFEREITPRLDAQRRWIGPVSGFRKWQLLQSARCVLVPSLIPETASLVAREALAAGTPVIAFPNGALAETIEHGRTGFLVDDVAAMTEALGRVDALDPAECRCIAQQRYSGARMTDRYLELYQQLVEAG